MARVVVEKDLKNFQLFRRVPRRLKGPEFETELHRAVTDTGRKTLTLVRRTARIQMNLKPGFYNSYVVANTRGTPVKSELAYYIEGGKKGGSIFMYRGLKGGRRLTKNGGYSLKALQQGRVQSAVWNVPRLFKRSWASGRGWYAMLPGGGHKAPRMLWTYGRKPNQGRDSYGRFTSTGAKYGKIRRLFGPSLWKELRDANTQKKGPNLIHIQFMRFAPVELEKQVTKRITKFMKF